MAGFLQVGGTTITLPGGAAIYDPQEAPWEDEGDEHVNHDGSLSSLAVSAIELRWQILSQAQASALLNHYYDTIIPAGGKVSSIRVPAKVATDTTSWGTAWKVYNEFDSRGIQVDRPRWTPDGVVYRDVTWRFHNVSHATEK